MKEKDNNEKLSVKESLARETLKAMVEVCKNHRKLGVEGRKKNAINQFNEQALRADLEAEQVIIEQFSEYVGVNNINLEVRGEETGTTILEEGSGEKYFAVLDGLDGSENYLKPNTWSYGTMFAIANGDNPRYQDFEVASIGFPEEEWVLIAAKGSGVCIYDYRNNTLNKLKPFGLIKYDEKKILSDNHFNEAKEMLGDMQSVWPRTGSNAASILTITIGGQIDDLQYPEMNKSWQGLADVTRKGNLEQPAIYLILKELGGVMVDKNGKDIGKNHFKDWGQKEKTPIISAKSPEIANEILSRLTLK